MIISKKNSKEDIIHGIEVEFDSHLYMYRCNTNELYTRNYARNVCYILGSIMGYSRKELNDILDR